MSIHLLAIVLVGGMAVGDSGDANSNTAAAKVPQTMTASEALLERAARDYRIQTYETFHNDRAEYDRRSAEGARVEAAWKEAGRNDAEQPLLIHWFDQATVVSRIDSIADLPAEPKFTFIPQKHVPEKKLVDSNIGDSVEDAAAIVDDLLHVKPVGAVKPAAGSTTKAPQTKSSPISSLPHALGAEISRALRGLAGKPAPNAVPPAAPKRDANVVFQPFTSKEGRFTAEFPGTPARMDREMDTPIGRVTFHAFTLHIGDSAEYLVSFEDLPATVSEEQLNKFDVERAFVGTRDGVALGSNVRVVKEREISLGKWPGREWEFVGTAAGNEDYRWRCYYVKTRQYQICVGWPKGQEPPKETERFLDSLKITAD